MSEKRLTREDISKLVLDATRRLHFNPSITEESRYGIDLVQDNKLKDLYYYALRIELENLGFVFRDFSPEDCVKANSIKDVVDAIWEDTEQDS